MFKYYNDYTINGRYYRQNLETTEVEVFNVRTNQWELTLADVLNDFEVDEVDTERALHDMAKLHEYYKKGLL